MHDLTFRYVEGLQWVMHYYYSGVSSWSWFYNYHYAPRISGKLHLFNSALILFLNLLYLDLKGIDQMSFHFELGKPFRPFEQLMGVLPEASKDLIPVAYRVRIVLYANASLNLLSLYRISCTIRIRRSWTSIPLSLSKI